jgi:SAM-dependent methyltransferase
LAKKNKPVTERAESYFQALQQIYPYYPEYGYDIHSIYSRAASRSVNILNLPGLGKPGLRGLDLGGGDGMLSVLLEIYGHSMTLADTEDWRHEAAKHIDFIKADCCEHLPIESTCLDFVVSYNSFEHFSNPTRALEEIIRLLRVGGLMYFQFNPLYCSPWGLHAYRSLRMPYPQFLFSEQFIHEKLNQIGIWDLGTKRNELQTLNGWKASQFDELWKKYDLQILDSSWQTNYEHLGLIQKFPEAFQGRGLNCDDLVKAGITILLRKE